MANKAIRSAKEEQQELEVLHRLDEECVYQQQAGNYLKAFDCMERALVLRRHFFGAESPEVVHACKALAEMCNLLAMSFLQQDNYVVTIDLLKKAEILTKYHASEKATTLNNLACYYRRLGKLHAAMTCLKRALELEKKLQNVRNAADTHLNICAVLSQLGKHQQALEQAQEALIILQEEFFQSKQTTTAAVEKPSGSSKKLTSQTQAAGGDATASSQQLDRVSVMCIAYHNIGVEQEFLKDYANSVVSYKKGVGLAEQYLGVDHAITTTVRNSYLAAKRTISTKSAGSSSKHKLQSSADSPLSKSPGKASTRLISSPRSNGSLTNSLRLPSPLSKEKQHHNIGEIPTPRSIVADVLSKGVTLPPLDAKSPFKSVLSPRDPFFSPRFRFDEDNGGGSVSKSPGSGKKKRKEVKFQPPTVAVEETEVAPTTASNNLSAPAVELMAAEVGSVGQVEQLPLLSVENAASEPPESSEELPIFDVSTKKETELIQDPMSVPQESDELRSPPPPVNVSDQFDSELTNSGENTEAGDASLPSEAKQSADASLAESGESQLITDLPTDEGNEEVRGTSSFDSKSKVAESTSTRIEPDGDDGRLEEATHSDHQPELATEDVATRASGDSENSHDLSAAAAERLPPSIPDDYTTADAAAEASDLDEVVQEAEAHDKEDILSLLDKSAGDLHFVEAVSDSSESNKLPVNPPGSDVSADSNVEVSSSATGASGVEPNEVHLSAEGSEASGSAEALASALEGTLLHEEDSTAAEERLNNGGAYEEELATADSENPPVATDQGAPMSESIAEMSEDVVVSGNYDHAESSASDLVDPDSHLYYAEEYDPTDSSWATENGDAHPGETHEGGVTEVAAAIDELHAGYNAGVGPPNYSHLEDPQPVFHPDDSSDYLDAVFEHDEFVPAGDLYHHEGAETVEYEYHHQDDTEATHGADASTGEYSEQHPTPDPAYDGQFEYEEAAAEHEEDHSYTYQDPGYANIQEFPPESAFFAEEGYSAGLSEDLSAFETCAHDDQAAVESELSLEHHHEVDSGSHTLVEAAGHDRDQDAVGGHGDSSAVEL